MFRRKNFFQWPPSGDSIGQCAVRDTKPSRPFSKTQRLAVECQHSSFAGILSLLKFCSPTAVHWPVVRNTLFTLAARIIAVIISSVNRGLWKWLPAYVSKEVIKTGSPSFAYRDASISVQMLVFVVRITSLPQRFPGRVFRRLAVSSRTCTSTTTRPCPAGLFTKVTTSNDGSFPTFAMAQPAGIATFSIPNKLNDSELSVDIPGFIRSLFTATARLDIAGSERTTAKNFFSSTFTAACPICASLASKVTASVANCCQFPKLLTRDIFYAMRTTGRLFVRHDSTPVKLDCGRTARNFEFRAVHLFYAGGD